MNVRETTEKYQAEQLSPLACLSQNSRGRMRKEEKCDIRTDFQRDRDRIIHSKAFRRLKHKTQVFLSPMGDHYRTRLTHTLEVSQIARTIARALRLNEDLTEAISLGHDLGHTPFGHKGESILNEICPSGFKHNEQSLRVVDVLEGRSGLNLTYEVRDGILRHTGDETPSTKEGEIVRIADKIAYINHDIDDAVRGGVLTEEDIPKEYSEIFGNKHSKRIDTMIKAMIDYSAATGGKIGMADEYYGAMMGLRRFMFENVYYDSGTKAEEKKAEYIIEGLYARFKEDISLIPEDARRSSNTDDEELIVKDYIAGMSDPFAVSTYENLFVPKFWV